MTETTIELAHCVRIDTDHRVWGLGCRAVCSCGWASHWTDHGPAATQAGVEHIDTAIGPPDAMDVLMGAMLDLQDDLASVVVWLAENWSADLPAPGLYPTTHYDDPERVRGVAGVALRAAAADAAVLARAADRLGVPVLTDEAPDGLGNRYQRATRRFGRVAVEVIRRVEIEP
jgi:hypothetical protein